MANLLTNILDRARTLFAPRPAPRPPVTTPARQLGAGDDAVVEPSARTWVEWTPSLVEAAEIQCSAGALRMAADLCHALLGDDRVVATLGVRTRGLMGLPVTFEPGGDKRRTRRVLRAIEADEDWWQMAPEADLAELLLWGTLLGVGFAKLVAVPGSSGRDLLRLDVWDPRWFRWDTTRRTWLVLTDAGVEIPVAADGRWVIYTPYGEHAPWQRGIWRALARWWLLKHYARSDWARHSEVKAAGLLVGFNPSAAQVGETDLSPKQRKALSSQLTNLGRDAALVLPRGLDLKLVESTAKNFETYQAQIAAADTGMAIAVLGQNLTTEVSGGSYAAAQVHQRVADYLRRADAETLSTTLREQVLVYWAAQNFRDPSVAPWPVWKVDPEADAKAVGERWKALGDGLAALAPHVPAGQVIDTATVFATHAVPLTAAPDPAPAEAPAFVADAVAGWIAAMMPGAWDTVDGDPTRLRYRCAVGADLFEVDVLLAAGGVTNFPTEGDDEAVSLRNSRWSRPSLDEVLALRDGHPEVWARGGNTLGTRQFARLLPVVRRGGRPATPTEDLAIRLREAWSARHAGAGTGATIAGAVAAWKWWTELGRGAEIRRVIRAATTKD